MYFNLFNCPLNKSVCFSIDGSATVSPASCLFITQIVDSLCSPMMIMWEWRLVLRLDSSLSHSQFLSQLSASKYLIIESFRTFLGRLCNSIRIPSNLRRIKDWKIVNWRHQHIDDQRPRQPTSSHRIIHQLFIINLISFFSLYSVLSAVSFFSSLASYQSRRHNSICINLWPEITS